jgi:TetR/AcrR family transcriptional regulator
MAETRELVYRPVRTRLEMTEVAVRSNDRILQKALGLFSEKGYDATSVREICEAAGVTKPTLYHFYGSKEGVYRAIVEGALDRFRVDLVRALRDEGPLRERLLRTARAYFDSATNDPDLARFVLGLIHNPPRSAPATDFLGFYRTVLDGFTSVVEAAAARGEVAPGPTAVRLLVFMGALGEAVHGHLLVGQPELTPELATTLVDTILWGWAAPPN